MRKGPAAVIVTCSQCQTQFRLDEERVGARGLRVRCSRCQHAFNVMPETTPAATAPESEPDLAALPDPPPVTSAAESPEESWSFEVPERPRSFERRAPLPLDEPAADAAESPQAPDLGAPESWDFLAGVPASSSVESAPEAAPAPPEIAARAESPAARPQPSESPLEDEDDLTPPATASLRRWAAAIHSTAAWSGTAALTLWGVALVLWPDRIEPRALPAEQSVAGLELRVDDTRYVENATAGPLFVVSGELRGSGSPRERGPLLELVLPDAGGRSLAGSETPLGPPISDAELREERPDALLRRQWQGAQALAERPLRPGERGRFAAVVVAPPVAGSAWRIRELAAAPRAKAAAERSEPGVPRPEAFLP